MAERRPTNSELRLARLEDEEPARDEEHGIFELFERPPEPPDEDAPLQRDPAE